MNDFPWLTVLCLVPLVGAVAVGALPRTPGDVLPKQVALVFSLLTLAVVVGIFAAAFLWMRKLSAQQPVAPFLTRPGQHPNPHETRVLTTLIDQPGPGSSWGVVR